MNSILALSSELQEQGPGCSFQVQKDGRLWTAFIIRYEGKALCYLNACAHVGLKLNGDKNTFFDQSGKSLMCRAHGAVYEAGSGKCIDGPCQGYGLISLAISEREGAIHYEDEIYTLVA